MRGFFGIFLVLVLLAIIALFLLRNPDTDIGQLEARYGGAPSQFITLPLGERVHLRDQGNQQGRVILLLHGTSSSLHTWENWVAALGDTYRIITVDLPGHGLTGPIPGCDYSVECSVRMIEDLREHLGLAHFIIGGNSFGGNIAWRYALANPADVDGLILSNASGGPGLDAPASTLAFRLAGIPIANHLLEIITPRAMVEKGLQDAVHGQSIVTEAKIDRYWALTLRPGNRRALRMRFQAKERGPLFHQDLANMQIPTLILWGREDQFVSLADGEWFARTIAGAKMAIYDDVGHLPMIEVPNLSAADVRSFLQNIPLRVEPIADVIE